MVLPYCGGPPSPSYHIELPFSADASLTARVDKLRVDVCFNDSCICEGACSTAPPSRWNNDYYAALARGVGVHTDVFGSTVWLTLAVFVAVAEYGDHVTLRLTNPADGATLLSYDARLDYCMRDDTCGGDELAHVKVGTGCSYWGR
jgi:hypothetical protein